MRLNDFNLTKQTSEAEGEPEGVPHISKELISHIIQQVGTEGAHAIVKSLQWGDGAAKELLQLIVKDLKQDISMAESVKQRLDPSCWKGKHKEGTKIKGGVKVNNCVAEATEPTKTIAKTWDQMTPQEKISGVKGRTVWNPETNKYRTVFDVPATKAPEQGVAEEQLGELSRDTLKSYVPKRIEKTQGMLAKEFDKSKRIIKKDLPRAMAKLKDPTYGKAKPTSESMAGVGMEPHAREQSMMMRGYAGGESMGDAGGAVIATYTIYDRHDRKMVKSRKFASEGEAQAWAHRNNATIVRITPIVKESAGDRPDYALLTNGKVIYKYKDSGEAESNLRLLRSKFPQQNFELKQEVCTLQPIGENVVHIGESYEAEMAKAIQLLEGK